MDFLRPGLKTGVENGIFGLKLGLDLEIRARAAHPHQKFQRVPPPPEPGVFLKDSSTYLNILLKLRLFYDGIQH